VHRDPVTFTDGYFDEHCEPPWDHAQLPWVDFGVPDATELRVALEGRRVRSEGG
jgi:hypothetical protein